jgi:hypothetical protein
MWHPWKRGELHTILVVKLDRKRPLGRLMCRWEDNIKVYLDEFRFGQGWSLGGASGSLALRSDFEGRHKGCQQPGTH